MTTNTDATQPSRCRRGNVRVVLFLGALMALAWVLAGCSPGNLLDDRNPFYLRGLRLRQENKYEEAAAAFDKCLRISPGSSKAHLQLAMLYEDRLGDPLQAVYHYHQYLRQVTAGENREMVQKWVTRAERTVLQQLVDKYPEDVDILLGKSQSAQGTTALSPREQYLIQRVRKMGTEIVSLRQALAKSDTVGLPAGSAIAAPEPRLEEPPATAEGPVAEPTSEPATEGVGKAVPPALSSQSGTGNHGATAVPSGPAKGGPASRNGGAAGGSPGSIPQAGAESTTSQAAGSIAGVPEPQGRAFVPLRRLSAGGTVPVAPGGGSGDSAVRKTTNYVVQKGDTLTSVAKKLSGTSAAWKSLQEANRDVLKGSAVLRPGMVLRVPDRSAGNTGKGQ